MRPPTKTSGMPAMKTATSFWISPPSATCWICNAGTLLLRGPVRGSTCTALLCPGAGKGEECNAGLAPL